MTLFAIVLKSRLMDRKFNAATPFNPFVVAFSPQVFQGSIQVMPWQCSHRDTQGKVTLAYIQSADKWAMTTDRFGRSCNAWCSQCGVSWTVVAKSGARFIIDEVTYPK